MAEKKPPRQLLRAPNRSPANQQFQTLGKIDLTLPRSLFSPTLDFHSQLPILSLHPEQFQYSLPEFRFRETG